MATPEKAVFGWVLDREDRARLLEAFAPRYPDAVADHVTLGHGDPGDPLPQPAACDLIGYVDDGAGLEAMVARIDGSWDRPDGGTFHVTWSLDRAAGRRAVRLAVHPRAVACLPWAHADSRVELTWVGASSPRRPPIWSCASRSTGAR